MALTDLDRRLLKRCLAKQPGAWKGFVDRFMGLFVHVVQHTAHVHSLRLSKDDIDDLCADIFVGILVDDYAVLRRFRGRSSLATYLTVIARRIVVRKMSERRMAEALGHVNAHQVSLERADALTSSPATDDREEVAELLKDLEPRDATVLRLSYLESKTYSEIAEALGVPENSVGPMLTRAKRKLHEKRRVRS